MFTKTQNNWIQNTLLVLAIMLVAGGVFFASQVLRPSSPPDAHCDLAQQRCLLTISGQTLEAQFQTSPVIEEELTLELIHHGTLSINSVEIRGVNMYMGVIPVVQRQQNDKAWLGWTYLGACSEPNMVWEITVKIDDSEEVGRLRFKTSIEG